MMKIWELPKLMPITCRQNVCINVHHSFSFYLHDYFQLNSNNEQSSLDESIRIRLSKQHPCQASSQQMFGTKYLYRRIRYDPVRYLRFNSNQSRTLLNNMSICCPMVHAPDFSSAMARVSVKAEL